MLDMLTVRLSQALTEVATMVARALYIQAGGDESQLQNINADRQIVRLLASVLGGLLGFQITILFQLICC